MANEQLRFVHTTVHEVVGIVAPPETEIMLVDDHPEGPAVFLTQDPDPYCLDADQLAALGTVLLQGLKRIRPAGTFIDRFHQECETARAQRSRRDGQVFLVFRREGVVEDWQARNEQDTGEFIIRLNGAPSGEIQAQSRLFFDSLVLALFQVASHPIRVSHYSGSVVYHRSDGKRIFSKKPTAAFDARVSVSLPAGAEMRVQSMYHKYARVEGLSRVIHLFSASVGELNDPLRAFQSAWAALEIFVNKLFKEYESQFYAELLGNNPSDARRRLGERIRTVMSGRFAIADKFALLAERLEPERAADDVKIFVRAKKLRDRLAHGEDVEERTLPVESVHQLLTTYVASHTDRIN